LCTPDDSVSRNLYSQPTAYVQYIGLDDISPVYWTTGLMKLASLGHLVAERRRANGLTLVALAASAGIGRSTLAALEAGKISELGFAKVARVCAAVGLVLEVRPLELDAPLMSHRHLTEAAGRDLTKSAIEDIIVRGNIAAWRGLVRALRTTRRRILVNRVQEVISALDQADPKVRAFSTILPGALKAPQ
jgi:transcriptional regulator with XRE-family HTH domain